MQEIVLTGIHISSYGEDTGEELFDLLHRLDSISGIRRIRLGSLEPHILTEDFVCRLKTLGKVCPHFHISLQSGSSSVLKRMNRKYTASQFAGYLDTIRRTYDLSLIHISFLEGMKMIMRQMQDSLKSLGVEEIPAEGQFDPEFHNAVMQAEEEGYETNQIIEVLQKGYSLNGKVLRHSMVRVAK